MATGRNPVRSVARSGWEIIVYLAMALFIFLAPVFLRVIDIIYGGDLHGSRFGLMSKNDVGPIYLASFLVDAFLLTWLLVAGPSSKSGVLRIVSHGFAAVVTWKPFVFLGQHSLQVFSVHIFYIYIVALMIGKGNVSEGYLAAFLLSSPVPMFLGAWLDGRWKNRNLGSASSGLRT
ncbi:OpgC domain-containing protein [Rubellimicrobium arenae]|uniref:OpgC domain-containing protein n=1 Tax=Rubellimicrobium arenae TaxID=2817372 RepID=UPI0034A1F19E